MFRYKIKHQNITIYTNNSESHEQLILLINKANTRLKESSIYVKKNHKIFFWNNTILFKLQTLKSNQVIAVNNPVLNKIHVAHANIEENIAYSNNGKTKAMLDAALSHEITHTLLRKQYGVFKFLSMPTWKNDGYCEYVGGSGSFDYKKGINLICNEEEDESSSFKYFKYKLYVSYLIDIKKKTINEIVKEDFNLKDLHNEVVDYYCNKV